MSIIGKICDSLRLRFGLNLFSRSNSPSTSTNIKNSNFFLNTSSAPSVFSDKSKEVASKLWSEAVNHKAVVIRSKFPGQGDGVESNEFLKNLENTHRYFEDNSVYLNQDLVEAGRLLYARVKIFVHSQKWYIPGDPAVRHLAVLWRNFEKEIRKVVGP